MVETEQYWNPVLETMPRKELEKLQLKKFKRTMKYAMENTPFYRKKYEEAGITADDIKTLDDVRKVPLVDKDEYRLAQQDKEPRPYGDLLGVPLEQVMSHSQTSGTTGTPVYLPDSFESFEDWKESWCCCLYAMGFRNTDIVFMPWPYNVYLGFWMGHLSAQKIGCKVFPGGGLDTKARIRAMKEVGATAVMCTPTYGFHMAKVALEMGIDPAKDLTIRKIAVMAEPVTKETKLDLEKLWGADVYEQIGSGESGHWACTCSEKRGMHILEHFYLLEVLDKETCSKPVPQGEQGIAVITAFVRRSIPCIRFNLKDLMTISKERCPCGRTSRMIESIPGRADHVVKLRGVLFSPVAIEELIGTKFPEISEFEIVASKSGTKENLLVKVEPNPGVDKQDFPKIRSRLVEEIKFKTNLTFEIEFVPYGSLPRYEIKSRRFKDLRGK
jgi:phenylacetate-CoA ligase